MKLRVRDLEVLRSFVDVEFEVIKNGIDERFFIIRDVQSGYYNATKTAVLFKVLKNIEEGGLLEEAHVSSQNSKRLNNWTRTNNAIAVFEEISIINSIPIDKLTIKVENCHNDFKGTYIHPKLYDLFLTWLDSKYAVRVANILHKFHEEANAVILKQKDDQIAMLMARLEAMQSETMNKLNSLSEDNVKLLSKNDELLSKNDELKYMIEDLHEDNANLNENVNELHETIETIDNNLVTAEKTLRVVNKRSEQLVEALVDKSLNSTKPPRQPSLRHKVCAIVKDTGRYANIEVITGQSGTLERKIASKLRSGFQMFIEIFPIANGIDYRVNVKNELTEAWQSVLASNEEARGYHLSIGSNKITFNKSCEFITIEEIQAIFMKVKNETQAAPEI